MIGNFDLTGKAIVVVGGGGTIGSAIGEGLSESGATVAIASRKLDTLTETARAISSRTGKPVDALRVDVSDEASVVEFAEEAVSRLGAVDVLINAQGVTTKAPAAEFDVETWNEVFALNVTGVMLTCREFGKHMIARKSGKIINLSSVRGSRATLWSGNLAYCSSKGAVDMLTRMLASEWAEHNITVNAVAPALVARSETWATRPKDQVERYLANIPLKRVADPAETAGAVVFLASSASDYITGQILFLDGGLTAVA